VVVTIGGERLKLIPDGEGGWYVQALKDGTRTRASADDVNALLGIKNRADYSLELDGVPLGQDVELSAALQRIRGMYDRDHLAVLVDATTLENASAAISGRLPGPLQLMDLALLVQAVVCNDVVLAQQADRDPLGGLEGAPPVFVSLDFSRQESAGTLWSLCVDELRRRRGIESDLAANWQEFLGLELRPRIDLDHFDTYQNSPGYWDGVVASAYADIVHAGVLDDPEELGRFLSIHSFRTFFNDRLAGLINEPYWASSFRAPVTSRILREKAETRAALDRLFASIGPRSEHGPNHGPYVRRVALPPLTAIVLTRITSLDEFWPAVEDLRSEFAPFRDVVRRDRQDLPANPSQLVDRYARHLSTAGQSLDTRRRHEATVGEVAGQGIAVAASSAALSPPLAAVLVKLVATLGGGPLRDAFLRLTRPDLHVIANIAAEAGQLVDVGSQLERLWGRAWSRERHEQLERLAAAQPQRFLHLVDAA